MRQELVFIGQNLNQKAMIDTLDNCLITDEQLLAGKSEWALLDDPFPAWE